MPRKPDPQVAERNQKMCQEFLASERRIPTVDLGRKYGVTPSRVGSILAAAGLVSRENRRTPGPYADRKPASVLLKSLGSVLSEACQVSDVKPSLALAMNESLLTRMKSGLHDFSVTELERIAAWMGVSVIELLRRAEGRVMRVKT